MAKVYDEYLGVIDISDTPKKKPKNHSPHEVNEACELLLASVLKYNTGSAVKDRTKADEYAQQYVGKDKSKVYSDSTRLLFKVAGLSESASNTGKLLKFVDKNSNRLKYRSVLKKIEKLPKVK